MRPQRPHDIEAEIQAFATTEGGRKSPLYSGYRPCHDFGKNGELNDGHHEYPDGGQVEIGHSGRALIWLLAPERNEGLLEISGSFTVQEGSRIIGRGKITSLPNATLRKNG
jgi:translation elongation factor EF-Tu-like GTPase